MLHGTNLSILKRLLPVMRAAEELALLCFSQEDRPWLVQSLPAQIEALSGGIPVIKLKILHRWAPGAHPTQ